MVYMIGRGCELDATEVALNTIDNLLISNSCFSSRLAFDIAYDNEITSGYYIAFSDFDLMINSLINAPGGSHKGSPNTSLCPSQAI